MVLFCVTVELLMLKLNMNSVECVRAVCNCKQTLPVNRDGRILIFCWILDSDI